ncbi:MAG TPA: hypothetical protein VJA18_04945 [Candidatus Nanoarchaeia archaeon]|nr:hypothetical protein [Candidatus Nanoarchaeia archaeon]
MEKRIGFLIALGAYVAGGATCGSVGSYLGYQALKPQTSIEHSDADSNPDLCLYYPLEREMLCSVDANGDGAQDVLKVTENGQEVLARGRTICLYSMTLTEEQMNKFEKSLQEVQKRDQPKQ